MADVYRSLIALGLAASVLAIPGCMSIRSGELQKYQTGMITPTVPPITVQVNARTVLPVPFRYETDRRRSVEFRNQLMKESQLLFSKAGIQAVDDGSAGLRLAMELHAYSNGLSLAKAYYYVLSSLTLTILPAREQESLVLGVNVEKDGRLLKRYHYRVVIDTWIQLFLLAGDLFSSETYLAREERFRKKAIDELLYNFIVDFKRDYPSLR